MFVLNVNFWRIVQVQFFFFAQYLFVSKLQLWRSGSAANDRDPQTSTALDYQPLICFSQPYNVVIMIRLKINKNLAYIRCIFPHWQLLEAMDIRFRRGFELLILCGN